ncbi:MAG: S-layer homology domain-containing protein, partial [Anaerovoracaceae bacterium]
LDSESALKNLQYNSYPYANPVVSDDGKLVVYLSDMDSTEVEKTRAAFATRNGNSYQMGKDGTLTAINDNGYGDSQLSLSGREDFAVAAWARQTAGIHKDSGAAVTDQDQMIMLNSTEVCASVYTGGSWTTTQLSENASPDLAPVTAANGRSGDDARAIVAWRAVSASGKSVGENSAQGVTSFDEKDTIVYRIYDPTAYTGNNGWSDIKTLYNGTSGGVKAISAAMLEDGTAAIAYTLDTDGNESTASDREIVYAVVGKDDGEVSRNVRATNDAYLDENPQLTAIKFGDEQRFVLGWYTEQAVAADSAAVFDGGSSETVSQTVSDIRLLDFNAAGVTEQRLPDSISQAADAYDVNITSNFRFTKGSDTISDLSILWAERAEGTATALEDTQSASDDSSTERDVLKGVKFYTYGQNQELVSFTGAVDVAQMPDSTLIDHFDAYVSDPEENEIKAVILGSTYGADGTVTRTGKTVAGVDVEYTVPSRTTSMYTATETYQDKIEVPALYADYQTVKLGAKTQIQFTIDNRGIHAIETLEINVGGQTTTYDNLNLLPGGSIQLDADYMVPKDGVVDPDYTVKATFNTSAGASGSAETTAYTGYGLRQSAQDLTTATGTVYLDLPDVEITDASVVKEVDGKRTIRIKLNNQADAALTSDDHKVKLSFYSDAACETQIASLSAIIISSDADLKMINEGGYSVQTTFDVGAYVKAQDGTAQEIPESGVKVYIKAEVLDAGSGDKVQGEPVTSDNYASVTCENLRNRTGEDVTILTELAAEGTGSKVTVTLQNNRLTSTATGNVIVTLLDEKGNVLEQKQSYTGNDSDTGLITLAAEERKQVTFNFAQKGISAQVSYSDAKLENNTNANLASLTLEGVTLTFDAAAKTYSGTADNLFGGLLQIVPEDPRASVTVNGAAFDMAANQSLQRGQNNITIKIIAADGSTSQSYLLHVNNQIPQTGGGGGGSSNMVPVPEQPQQPQPPQEPQSISFTDVAEGSYYSDAVAWAVEKGITLGTSDSEFSPERSCTRAQAVTFLWRAAGCPEPENSSGAFNDVAADSYYAAAVRWAVEQGITNGTGKNTFSPDAVCTRAQIVTFLWRLQGASDADSEDLFADVPADAYYAHAVSWALKQQITNGTGNAAFSPAMDCNRAQIVTFLFRCFGDL